MTSANANCGRIAIAAEPVEQIISEAVLVYIQSGVITRALRIPKQSGGDDGNPPAPYERKLIELEQMWAAGDITTREWLADRTPLDEIAEEAQRALARDRGREAAVILRSADPAKIWHKFDTAQQRAIIASGVERITIAPANGRAPIDRVNIEWQK